MAVMLICAAHEIPSAIFPATGKKEKKRILLLKAFLRV